MKSHTTFLAPARRVFLVAAGFVLTGVAAIAADWPTFRHDPARTAATDEQLPQNLHLRWSRQFPELVASWQGEFPHLRFDANYEPLVVGKTLYVGSSDDDSVTALDTETGAVKWRFYANGPVRLAPVGCKGRVYFGADDAVFYCLDGDTGKLLWKFDTALSDRRGFVEDRLTTICPIRGGPVIDNGRVHFTAGIWAWEPAAFFTLDADTGDLIRCEKGTRSQGYVSAIGSWLYFPNGRASGRRFRRDTLGWAGGFGGWAGYWDHLVTGSGEWIVRMGALQKLAGKPTGLVCEPGPGRNPICFYRPIIDGDTLYYSAAKKVMPRVDLPGPQVGDIVAVSLKDPQLVPAKDAKGKPILDRKKNPKTKLLVKELWRMPNARLVERLGGPPSSKKGTPMTIVELKAGSRLYGYRGSTLFALDLLDGHQPPRVSWHATVEGTPARMIAADGKLFVVTQEGWLYCFGGEAVRPKVHPLQLATLPKVNDVWSREKMRAIMRQAPASEGYCLVLGLQSGRLVEELLRRTRLDVIAMDKDPRLVRRLRERFYSLSDRRPESAEPQTAKDGTPFLRPSPGEIAPQRRRVTVIEADPTRYAFPPYLASLIVSEAPARLAQNTSRIVELFKALRPYGGTLCLELPASAHAAVVQAVAGARLAQAQVRRDDGWTVVSRPGPLPGAANWTHEWADAANTLKSEDRLRFPLGMLWVGGRSARRDMYFDRHFLPPAPVVIDGRMFIEGPTKLVAVDIYTGRILWEVHSKAFASMTRGRGGCHTVGASDGIYVSTRKAIFRFDPATGKLMSEFSLPRECTHDEVWDRPYLWKDAIISIIVKGGRHKRMVSLDRHTGAVHWIVDADSSFSYLALGNERVFTYDGSARDLALLRAARRGQRVVIPGRAMKAFDVRDGAELWRRRTDGVVDWLSYSVEMDVLVASARKCIRAYRGANGAELWRKYSEGIGFLGHPRHVWQKVILWHDWMIDQRGPGLAYHLLTGLPVQRPHPVTLKPVPWEFIRYGHHCNHAIASENFLTFRSGNATFVDLTTLGTGVFPGFRTGCTNSLVVAGGVLNSPMYAHLCVCGYEFYTSLAFTHMPNVDAWTYRPNKLDFLKHADLGRVQRLGVNLNAPGERRAANGTLWFGLGRRLAYGLAGLSVNTSGARPFNLPVSEVKGAGPKWVVASGYEGLKPFSIPLCANKKAKPATHKVRLYFIEPSKEVKPGDRVFSVKLQDRQVLTDFDIAKAAEGYARGVVKEFTGVRAGAVLKVALLPKKGAPVLCGVEIVNDAAETIAPEVHNTVVRARVGEPVEVRLFYEDFDGPGPFTFSITKPPAKGALSGIGPTVTYRSQRDAFGKDEFWWTVSDGQKTSSEAKVMIRLLRPNLAPKAQYLWTAAIAGKPVAVVLPFSDADESPGLNRFTVLKAPAHGTMRWQGYNRFTYTPQPAFTGIDAFTWKMNDGRADSNVATVTIRVEPDVQGPKVARIDSAGPNDRVIVVFDEPVVKADAENPSNYTIDHGVQVRVAALSSDGKRVTLTTSELTEDVRYVLSIRNIRDCSTTGNRIDREARFPFQYVLVGNGLFGEYFDGKDFSGRKLGERIDPRIDFNWRAKPPLPGMKVGQAYSVRWTGRLKADYTEEYLIDFYKGWEHNRNPVCIWIDGQPLHNESAGGAAVERSAFGRISLEAGRVYDLKVELSIRQPKYSKYADIYILRWSSLSTPRQPIPQANLGTPRKPRVSTNAHQGGAP